MPAHKVHCSECGAELPVATLGNRCPRCVLRLGLQAAAATEVPTRLVPLPEATPPPLARVRYFGDYELLEEIARGGMGIVYKARQVSLNRLVAVKMILFGEMAGKGTAERFRREAEAAAQLQHPNIVAVHEVGEHEGQQYFSMDYVAGPNLAALVENKPLRAKRAARYVQLIAEAIAYAHQQGVLHRDLKPSNVLIDPMDQPRVTDFGLAKSLSSNPEGGGRSAELTISGQVLGTPNYLPPEQAAGRRETIGPASDVYGLGAILYFLLTARPPFTGESLETTLGQVLHQEPVSPRLLNGSVPRDLETICLKCLEKEPTRRYATAQALADDVSRYLRNEPIMARPVGAAGKTWRWCRRKPVVAGLSAGLVLAMVVGFAGVTWQWRQTEQERQLQRRIAYGYSIPAAQLALQQNDPGRAASLLELQQPRPGESEDLRGIEWRYLWEESRSDEMASFEHPHFVRDAAISPDGKTVVTSCYDSKVRIWGAASGKRPHEIECTLPSAPRNCLGFAADGQWLVMPGTTGDLEIRETTTWSVVRQLPSSQPPLAISTNGTVLVADGGSWTNTGESLVVWNLKTGTEQRLPDAAARFRNLAISGDGSRIVYSANDPYIHGRPGPILLRELNTGVTHVLATSELTVSLAMSPDGKWLASGSYSSGEIRLWDLDRLEMAARFTAHQGGVVTLAFSPDSQVLASGGIDQLIHLWHVGTSNPLTTFQGHRNGIHFCAFSRDGTTLISTSTDHTAKLWRVEPTPARSRTFPVPPKTIAFGVLADASALLAVDEQQTNTHLLSLSDGRLLRSNSWSQAREQGCCRLRFFPRELAAVGVSTNGTVHIWDLMTGAHQKSVALSGSEFDPASLSPDHRWLIGTIQSSGGPGAGDAYFWDLSHERRMLHLRFRMLHFFVAGFSPDSRWLSYSDTTDTVHVWDLSTQREQPPLNAPGHGILLATIRFSPDAKLLATGGWDGLWVWSVDNWTPLRKLTHRPVNHVCFSADGKTIAADLEDLSIHCWSVSTGQEVLLLRNATLASGDPYPNMRALYTMPAEFNPGGNLLVWQEEKGEIRVTPLPTLAQIDAMGITARAGAGGRKGQ